MRTPQRAFVPLLLVALATGLAFASVAAQGQQDQGRQAQGQQPQGQPGQRPSLAPLVGKVSPAVVNISTRGTVDVQQHPLMQHPFFRRFFDMPEGMPQQRQVQSLGSGVIVDAEGGRILTNHHVIANADQITVGLQDGREFEAKVIGSDPETDVAVIQIDAGKLQSIPLGNSDNLQPGDFVVALGNPFGLEHTVTGGMVSALGRSLPGGGGGDTRIQHFIQTDASINPGNSGGALVNLQGELVGINTAILARGGGNIGIGFAIPINIANTVMEQIAKYGEVRRGMLGVQVQDLSADLAEALGIKQREGALVSRVVPGSAAEQAGIRQGDVITAVNDEPIQDASELAKTIGLLEIGNEVKLQILRDGSQQTVTAKVGQPQQPQRQQPQAGTEGDRGPLAGVKLAELDQRSPLYGEVEGVMVAAVRAGSEAAQYLQPGDVITSVNRQPVTSPQEVRKAAQGADQLLLHVRRGESAQFVMLE